MVSHGASTLVEMSSSGRGEPQTYLSLSAGL